MSAVVMFLNESVVDSLKGAYRLRKAYQLLHKLFDMIVDVDGTTSPAHSTHFDEGVTKVASPDQLSDASSDLFVDASDDPATIEDPISLPDALDNLEISNGTTRSEPIPEPPTASSSPGPEIERHASIATVSSFLQIPSPPQGDMTITDDAVYSGTLMALGAIMLLISLLPPSLSRLLSIIGFRGSRTQALAMLWKTTGQQGPFGGLSTFFLGTYYGNIVQNADIVPDDFSTKKKSTGSTIDRLYLAIARARQRYPESALWAVEEARMESIRGHLEEVVHRLESISLDTQMPQIQSYVVFEGALYSPRKQNP
jgi:Protein of unknown function (DUF3808)